MFGEQQIMLANKIAEIKEKSIVWHLDATGSLVRKISSAPVYLYALVVPVPIIGEPCLPLLEWLSDAHDASTLSSTLLAWWTKVRSFIIPANTIVLDFSWALMHTVALVFNSMTLDKQLNLQWSFMNGSFIPPGFICIRLCAAHLIKAISNRLKKLNIKKEVNISVI